MRKFEYLSVALFSAQALACTPPAGFVNPPLPDIAPLEQMLSHTETRNIDRPLASVMQGASRPLEQAIRPTKDLPGVSGTYRLSDGPYGTVGARRLVCLTDGNVAVEEVLLTESGETTNRFRYVVWNYTNPKFDDVSHAVGEFIRTQPEPGKTRVSWTYRFELKPGRDREVFRKEFLETIFAEWMRNVLGIGHSTTEAASR
ncbi:MAG: hypothetical protein K0Q92_2240 [Steroidobacteraceae bacterium]|jgi:hypothetical protein|nr:hypothetical protein [Steroidobacteraceae bacterium]